MNKLGVVCGLLLLVAVLMGAFAAHGLKPVLTVAQLATLKTAVLYQFVHGLGGLIAIALADQAAFSQVRDWLKRAVISFVAGILLFCFSLYGLVLTELQWLGPVTPMGGFAFILGWLFLSIAFIRKSSRG